MKISLQYYLNLTLACCLSLGGSMKADDTKADDTTTQTPAAAIFAGGCFWCMEPPFDVLPGVISTISGYTGGATENPTYEEVSNGNTGHLEAIQVTYDPAKISYGELLEVFWRNIDPFDDGGQFCDQGDQYKAAIFYQDENQKKLAETSKIELQQKLPDKNLVTSIKAAGKFFSAEDYHQDYYQKNPTRYKFYRLKCGRDRRLNQVWGE
jgi:peptide-methionine (S)-S-oxide reductase